MNTEKTITISWTDRELALWEELDPPVDPTGPLSQEQLDVLFDICADETVKDFDYEAGEPSPRGRLAEHMGDKLFVEL